MTSNVSLSVGNDDSGDDEDEKELLRQINERNNLSPRSDQVGHGFKSSAPSGAAAEPTFSLRELKTMKRIFEETPEGGMTMQEFVRNIGPQFIRLSSTATNRDIELLFKRIDANANGSVDWDEFSAFLLMNDVKATLKLTAEAKSKDFAAYPSSKEAQMAAHHALRHVLHKEPINRLLVHPKYSKYFTSSNDGMVKVWNSESMRHMQTVQATTAAVTDMVLTPWYDTVAVAAMDNTISFYSCDTGDHVRCYRGEHGSRVGSRLKSGELIFDSEQAVVKRPHFAIPVNRQEGNEIKYGRSAHLFGKVDTTVPVLSHFAKAHEVPAISLSNFGSGVEGRNLVPVQAGYPSALNVCTIRNELLMMVGFDNGYMQLYPINGAPSQGPGHLSSIIGGAADMIYEPPKSTIRMHWDYISRIIPVPQMDLMLTSSYDGMIQVRTFDRMEEVNCLLGEGIVVNDRKSFSLGGSSSMVQDTALHGHSHRITYMDWNYECRMIASCAPEKDVLIWSPYIPKPVTKLPHPKGLVLDVHFTKNSDQILTLCTDHVVRLWDIRTFRCVQALPDNSSEQLSCVQYDHRRECVVMGSTCLRTWGLVQTTDYHRKYSGHRRPVVASAISLPFHQLITADHKMIVVWDIATLDPVMRWEVEESIADIALDSNCRRLMVATLNGQVLVYNYVNGLPLKTFNQGGFRDLHSHYQSTHRRVESSEILGVRGDPELAAVRCADVLKPRPTSLVLVTLDDGLTAVFLDEEGGEQRPFRTLQTPSTSLTSMVDASYSILLLGHHAGLSACGLEESTSAVTEFELLPAHIASQCKVALFTGNLMEEPLAAVRHYTQNRDAIIGAQRRNSSDTVLPPGEVSTAAAAWSPMGNSQSGQSRTMSSQQSSKLIACTSNRNRRTSRTRSVSQASSGGQRNESASDVTPVESAPKDTVDQDLEKRQLQALGLIEKIVVMSSVEPHIIITGSSDGLIQLWDGRAQREVLRFRATPTIDSITALNITNGEDALLVGDNNGYVSIFDLTMILEESAQRLMSVSCSAGGVAAPLSRPAIREDMIQLRVRFRAHHDAISSIGLDEGLVARAVVSSRGREGGPVIIETVGDRNRAPPASYSYESNDSHVSAPAFSSTQRRRSFFLQPYIEPSASTVPNSPKNSPRKQRMTYQDYEITPTGPYVKVFTTSADTYGYVWIMSRRTCEMQLIACLGDTIFQPTLAAHHPQTLLSFDYVRCKLVQRYLTAEGRSTWSMIVAHFARVVEKRRVSLFSAAGDLTVQSIPYMVSTAYSSEFGDDTSIASSGTNVIDIEHTDDDDDDDDDRETATTIDDDELYAGSAPDSGPGSPMFRSQPRLLAQFSLVGNATNINADRENRNPLEQTTDMHTTRLTKKRTLKMPTSGRQLLKDVSYVNECMRAFDKTTYDDANLESLLRRLTGVMIDPTGQRERMAFVNDEGFYCAVQPPEQQVRSNETSTARQSVQRSKGLSFHGAATAATVTFALQPQQSFTNKTSSHEKSYLSEDPGRDNEIVEVVRPPRHMVSMANTTDVKNPPDITDIIHSAQAPKTVLVAPAGAFTGVRSVLRHPLTHPFVTSELLMDRGETLFLSPRAATATSVSSSASEPLAVFSSAEALRLEEQESEQQQAIVAPAFLTEVTLKKQRHEFMKSIMSYSSTTPSGGTPRETDRSGTPRRLPSSWSRFRGAPTLLLDSQAFVMPSGDKEGTTEAEGMDSRHHASDQPIELRGMRTAADEGLETPRQDKDELHVLVEEYERSPMQSLPSLTNSAKVTALPVPPHPPNSAGSRALPSGGWPVVSTTPSPRPQTSSSPWTARTPTTTQVCRAQTDLLDEMIKSARLVRDDAIAQSRKLHNGARPTWEVSDLQQRRMMRRGGNNESGGFIIVQGEDQTLRMRQTRTTMGGGRRLHGTSRRAQISVTGDPIGNEQQAQAHLNHFRDRAATLVGAERVHHLTTTRSANHHGGNSGSEKDRQHDHAKNTTDIDDPTNSEMLGDLQWVSRIHSKLDIPRSFELAPVPPSVEQALRNHDANLQMHDNDDDDHGWIRMLSTARGKKAAAVVRQRHSSPAGTARTVRRGGGHEKEEMDQVKGHSPDPHASCVHKQNAKKSPQSQNSKTSPKRKTEKKGTHSSPVQQPKRNIPKPPSNQPVEESKPMVA